MNEHALYHKPQSNYCFAYDKGKVIIRLRTAKGDLESAVLVYGDKYDFDNSKKSIDMELKYSDSIYDYYEAETFSANNRLAYYFEIYSNNEKYYFTEWGLNDGTDGEKLDLLCFHFPYINEIDIHKVPEWVKDAVFYQIFPERFNNGDKSNDPENVEEWGNTPKTNNFFGGDLQGIIDKVDYLSELGINAIYLTPIFESPSNHKYNTTDYLKIDSQFGDKDTLKKLVEKCHEKGIKVMLDAVFNHSGYDLKQFQDVVKNGPKSPYYDWFHIKKWPLELDPPSYDTFAFVPEMPKLNTENKEVMDYLLKVATYWIEECDIDGWRLDVANEVDHNFWREFRKAVKGIKEDAYILGEIWHDSLPWLGGDQFDAIMNYPLTRACEQFFALDKISNKQFKEMVDSTTVRNTKQVNEAMFNLLDSHDTSRFLTKCNEDKRKLMLAATFMFTYEGVPCIYYGTEIGMEGAEDPDCRRTMEWNEKKWNHEIYDFYKTIIKLRNSHKALRNGKFIWSEQLEDVVAYTKENQEEKILVILNNSDKVKEIELKGNKYENLMNSEIISNINKEMKLTLDKYSYFILKVIDN